MISIKQRRAFQLSRRKRTPASQESQNNQNLDKLYVKLNDYIKQNHLGPEMSLTNLPRGVQLTFREKILFDVGDADIKKGAKPILKKVGGILKMVPNDISVEGYTDNTPFRNRHSKYHSNWELSGARAQNVMFFLIHHDHLPPSQLHFVGYGQYKPVAKNDTAAHRAMNRRVNIVIMREQGQENQGN
ncbi:OmpA family protein [Terrilactibacillus sp. S3-3]|nr:OmpA family protein [Terrilactibacillus sp. S3-3]